MSFVPYWKRLGIGRGTEEGSLKKRLWYTVFMANKLGTLTAVGNTAWSSLGDNNLAVIFLSGTFSGANIAFEVSPDSTDGSNGTWYPVNAAAVGSNTVSTTTGAISAPAAFEAMVAGAKVVRVRLTAITSGSVGVNLATTRADFDPSPVVPSHSVTQSGTWNVGTVSTITNPVTVSSVTNPVTVSSITNSVTVGSITNPVTVGSVSSITNPVTVSSITNSVTVGSITNPVTVGSITNSVTVGSITNPVTVSTHAVTQSGTWNVVPTKATTGGLSRLKVISAATTNATVVKSTAGQLYSIHLFNTGVTARYVKFYQKATAPTVGTDTPVLTYVVPAGTALRVSLDSLGDAFTSGIGMAITGGYADTDTTAVAAGEVIGSVHYA